MTCHDDASHACAIDLGILLCPRTCGYCAPFEYEQLKRFGKPQVTLLPISGLSKTTAEGHMPRVRHHSREPELQSAADADASHGYLDGLDNLNIQYIQSDIEPWSCG